MPLQKPVLVVCDFLEAEDVLTRRTREFDKSRLTNASFRGVVGSSLICMKTSDPRFRFNKELVKDLMSPEFLEQVGI
jgi:hypothetical protein